MDPFHVVRLAGDALDRCRRRVQQNLHGHRGHKGDPLYSARRTLHTGRELLTDKQTARLEDLFAVDQHVEVEVTWWIYQRMIAAYPHDRARGRELMVKLIESISHGVPATLVETVTLGRTLNKRAGRRAGLLRAPRHIQRTDGGDQRLPVPTAAHCAIFTPDAVVFADLQTLRSCLPPSRHGCEPHVCGSRGGGAKR